jgi:GTPase-activating protein that regulates ARFs (ADP-ribosylation factors), involved in ARF-mediated vesicular transport
VGLPTITYDDLFLYTFDYLLQSLQQMGNSRARAVYEANIPDNFRRPQTDSTLEAFIRAKYEQKKYIASEWVPPVLPKVKTL